MKSIVSSPIYISATLIFFLCSCHEDDTDPRNLKDSDGNIYRTVLIENQIWMAENLKTTKYNDGSDIPVVADSSIWKNLESGALCWYKNEESVYKDKYGALYNGYAVSTGKLCPVGWHVPSLEELRVLKEHSGDTIRAGGRLKERGTEYWSTPNQGADNITGFSAVPAGIRYFEGSFSALSYFTSFWSATESENGNYWYMSLYYDDALVKIETGTRNYGFSVRCIRDW
jgi:uncharacterized protein (TIGR02145 family)